MPHGLRLLVLSDLHVDFRENRRRARDIARAWSTADADALVLAGDISHQLDAVEDVLRSFSAFSGPKLFVPGNHDIWIVRAKRGEPVTSWEKLDRLGSVCRATGFRYLEQGNARVAGRTFVGTLGWYDYSYANPAMEFERADYETKRWRDLRYMDASYARWGHSDPDVLDRLVTRVTTRLDRAEPPIVFVSHHLPAESYVVRKGHPGWDYFNAFMGSLRLEDVLAHHGVRRFIFGHDHQPRAEIRPGSFALNNPLGYPREGLEPRLAPFEVD